MTTFEIIGIKRMWRYALYYYLKDLSMFLLYKNSNNLSRSLKSYVRELKQNVIIGNCYWHNTIYAEKICELCDFDYVKFLIACDKIINTPDSVSYFRKL